MKILIVEDDVPIAELLRELLELNGHQVCGIARTLDEAVEESELDRPECAIIDVNLADGSLGTDLARLLHQIQPISIVFSTGYGDNSNFATHEGDAIMRKPYPIRDVLRGLTIMEQIALHGETELKFPPSFQIIGGHCARRKAS